AKKERDEKAQAVPLMRAWADFRIRHNGHSRTVLDNIDTALKKVTRNNDKLLVAYYRHYANHELTDEEENRPGSTSHGDTDIHPRVLGLNSTFPTDDPSSLLGSTLMHEFAHGPHGGRTHIVESAPLEAKAYGIEYFFAERMGDQKRMNVIYSRYDSSKPDPYDQATGGQAIFWTSYKTMQALYEVIDQGRSNRPSIKTLNAEGAKDMTVEFMSRNPRDYGAQLKSLVSEVSH